MQHIHLDSCDSTQSLLKEKLTNESSYRPFLISTSHQSQGHGRRGKAWVQPDDGLAFSFSLLPQDIPTLTSLEVGLLIAKFFRQHEITLTLKWPNDLINAKGEKCGGILLSNNSQGYFIVGVGLNIGQSPQVARDHFPAGSATDQRELNDLISQFKDIKKDLPEKIYKFILKNRLTRPEQITSEWRQFCYHLNKEVKIVDDQKRYAGIFIGIDRFGQAQLKTLDTIKIVSNGSLFLV